MGLVKSMDECPNEEEIERFWNGDESVGYYAEGVFYLFDDFSEEDDNRYTPENIRKGIITKTRKCLIRHGVTEDTKIRIQGQTLKGIDSILEFTLSYRAPRFWIYYHLDCSNERKAKTKNKADLKEKEA